MSLRSRLSQFLRASVVLATIASVSLALVVGRGETVDTVELAVGQPSPETFVASRPVEVVDVIATDNAKAAAANAVTPITRTDDTATNVVLTDLQTFFGTVRTHAAPYFPEGEDPNAVSPSTTSSTTTTTTSTTTTTVPETTSSTDPTGTSEGEDTTTSSTTSSTTTTSTTTTSTTTTTTLPPPLPLEDQIVLISEEHPLVKLETITALVDVINDDLERAADGEQTFFRFVEEEALRLADERLESGILPTELEAVRTDLVTRPPRLILLRDLPTLQRDATEAAVADLVASFLQANEVRDEAAIAAAQEQARSAVDDITMSWLPGEVIVRVGERVTDVELAAIQELGLLDPIIETPPLRAMAVVASLVVALGMFSLWRLGEGYWPRPKMVALFGLILVLAALAARIPDIATRDRLELGFLLPAALFGYLGASLFDPRVAVVLTVPVGTFTALATGDVALTMFAVAATLTPIPLVSSVSSRAQLNVAVVASAAAHAPLAGAIAWVFYGSDTLWPSVLFGLAGGVISGVAALGLLPFLSNIFGITTTQTLLDLVDRNHPALRRIEEMAPGTFNHSLLVGTLAGRAARAINANVLLAQAMAYYHDLGKTVHPQYFVENQFGVSNPHDQLPPEESAKIIRSHVSEGMRLAREYGLPQDVAQGILTHHGTSLMRYFYHRAVEGSDDVDPLDFRHRGRKPASREMVIVMLADAVEAATRSLVQNEDPTSEGIRKLVEQIISEKSDDGQLEESAVTFGDLRRIKEAFVDALIGYYHTRIPYPGFPEPGSAQPA